MRGFRLNGWQRIGIVLSALWAIGSWLYVEDAARKAAYEREIAYSDICTLNKERRNEWDVKPCFDQANRLYHTAMRPLGRCPWHWSQSSSSGDWSTWLCGKCARFDGASKAAS